MAQKTANQDKAVADGGLDFLVKLLGTEDSLQDEALLYEVIRALSVLVQQNPPHTKLIVSLVSLAFCFAFVFICLCFLPLFFFFDSPDNSRRIENANECSQ